MPDTGAASSGMSVAGTMRCMSDIATELRILRANGVDITDRWLTWARDGYAHGVVDADTFEQTVAHILANDPQIDVCEWVVPVRKREP